MDQGNKLIEDYLSGKLSPEEIAAVDQRLATDAAFARAFQMQKSMNAFLVRENNKKQLIPQLEELGKKHFEKTTAKTIGINRRRIFAGLAVAASIALLIFALNQIFQQPLYDQYAIHQPLNLIEKSESAQVAAEAQEQFNNKNYKGAYQSLTTYLEQFPDDTKAILAKGIAALELDQYEDALAIFDQIHKGSTAFQSTGTWYLALTYVKQKNFEKAKEFLYQIPRSEHVLYDKAQELMKRI